MKKARTGFSLPLFISFNELAWLAVVGVVLISFTNQKEQDPIPDDQHLKKQLQSLKHELEKGRAESENSKMQLEKNIAEKEDMQTQLQVLEREREKVKRELTEIKQLSESLSRKNNRLQKALNDEKKEGDLEKKNIDKSWIKQLAELKEQLKKEREKRKSEMKALEELENLKMQLASKREGVHKRLLGLVGDLSHVGILLDRSSSMKGERWEGSIKVVETWLEHLAMEQCFLITFNESATAFPPNYEYLDVSGKGGFQNRRQLIEMIRGIEPEGYTGTLKALEMAYRYPNLETILLFTDGDPKLPNETRKKVKQNRDEILALCRKGKRLQGVKVNAVAIGDYFEEDFGKFLLDVADETGGAFIGR